MSELEATTARDTAAMKASFVRSAARPHPGATASPNTLSHLWLFVHSSVTFWIANVRQPRCCVELAVHLTDLPGRCHREDINTLDFCDSRADTVGDPTPADPGAGVEDVQSRDAGDWGLCSLPNDERLLRRKRDSAKLLVSAGKESVYE